jgi:hypothetical protein
VVGGGVHGKAAGTAHITMTEVGFTTDIYHLLTDMFFLGGEIITGITGGIGYIIRKLYAIGGHGKETGTGNVCMEYRPDLGLHPLLGNLSCRIINRISFKTAGFDNRNKKIFKAGIFLTLILKCYRLCFCALAGELNKRFFLVLNKLSTLTKMLDFNPLSVRLWNFFF